MELLSQRSEEGWNIRANGLELLVVLVQEGPMFWCLDYRDCGPQGNPSVVLMNAETDPDEIRVSAKFRVDFTYYAELDQL